MGSHSLKLLIFTTIMSLLVFISLIGLSAGQMVYYPNGAVTPLDEPAVALARAEHLAAKAQVYAEQGVLGYAGYAPVPIVYQATKPNQANKPAQANKPNQANKAAAANKTKPTSLTKLTSLPRVGQTSST